MILTSVLVVIQLSGTALFVYLTGYDPVGAAGIAAMLVVEWLILNIGSVYVISKWIARKTREKLKEKLKESFDKSSNLMWHAGEGLAEAIAKRVLQHPDVNEETDPGGRDRFREQFWQMVTVGKDLCKVWIRKP